MNRNRYWWSYFQEKWKISFVTYEQFVNYIQKEYSIEAKPFLKFVIEQKIVDKTLHECIILWKLCEEPEMPE